MFHHSAVVRFCGSKIALPWYAGRVLRTRNCTAISRRSDSAAVELHHHGTVVRLYGSRNEPQWYGVAVVHTQNCTAMVRW